MWCFSITSHIKCCFSFLVTGRGSAQSSDNTYQIHGEVRDIETNQPLPAANVYLDQTQKETETNGDGHFTLTNLTTRNYILVATKDGYQRMQVKIPIPGYINKKIIIGLTHSDENEDKNSEVLALAHKIFSSIPDSLQLENIWKEGDWLLEETDNEMALQLWEKVYRQFSDRNLKSTDPRIGIRFIEFVTDQKNYGRYTTASEIYYWGLIDVSST